MKLITENIEEVELIEEETEDGEKSLYIEGIFLQSEIKNRNGRIYPFEVLNREVERYVEEYIDSGRALGELGHPDGPTVNLDRVSHLITSLKAEGNDFIEKAKILTLQPHGQMVENLLKQGVKLGVSSRGMGSLDKREDANYVCDDFMLATAADIVADPSAPSAFVNGIMEGKEWVWENGALKESDLDKYQRYIANAPNKVQLEERTLEAFEALMGRLSK